MKARPGGVLFCLLALAVGCGVDQLVGLDSVLDAGVTDGGHVRDGGDDDDDGGDDGDVRVFWGTAPDAGPAASAGRPARAR